MPLLLRPNKKETGKSRAKLRNVLGEGRLTLEEG